MIKIQGFCEEGNITVSIAGTGYTSSNKVQGSFPGCTVTVYLAGTLNAATIYADNAGTPASKSNPFVSQTDGTWFFYALPGSYDIKFSGAGIVIPFTLGAVGSGLQTEWSILDFGGAGDWDGASGTDNKPAFDRAIAQLKANGGGCLTFPASNGGYWFNGSAVINEGSGITLKMYSAQYNSDAGPPTKARIVFTASDSKLLVENTFGFSMIGIQVDGSNIALNGIVFDQVYLARCWDISVYRIPDLGIAWTMGASGSTPNVGSHWGCIDGVHLDRVGIGLVFTGTVPISGSYFCSFRQVKINFTGAAAVQFIETDNVMLQDLFLYRVSGSGIGLQYKYGGGGYYPGNISVDRITVAGNSLPVDTYGIEANVTNPGRITGIDTSNGGATPAIADNCNVIIQRMDINLFAGVREPYKFRKGTVLGLISTTPWGEQIRDDDEIGFNEYTSTHNFCYAEKNDHTIFGRRFYICPAGADYFNVMNLSGTLLQLLGGVSPGAPDNSAFSGATLYTIIGGDPSGTVGNEYSICFRPDGAAGHRIFFRTTGSWTAWATL